MRNDAVDDVKGEPLEKDCLLDGLGTSDKEALIVAVPSSAENIEADIVLATRELGLEIKENNTFMKKASKNYFSLMEPKMYKSDYDDLLYRQLIHYGMIPPTSTTLPQYAFCHMLGVKVPLKYLSCTHLFQKKLDAKC